MRAVLSSDAVTTRAPVGVEGRGPDLALMLQRLADRLAGAGVPDARRVVTGRGDDALARRVEGRDVTCTVP